MSLRTACALVAGPAFLFLGAFPAAALDAETVADALGAALTKGSRANAGYEAAVLDGANVIITGLTFTGSTSGEAVTFAKAVVESPVEGSEGLFTSPRITLSSGSAMGKQSGTIGSVTATDVTVLDPAAVEGDGFAEAILYRTAEISDVKVTRETQPRDLSVERIAIAFADTANAPRDVSGTVEGFSVSADVFEHRRFAILARGRRLDSLGSDALVFDADWSGTWDKAAGTMTVRESTLTFRDNAALSVTGTVGDLPDPRVLNDKDVLSQVATLTFHNLVVRYEENSLLGRVFDMMAEEQEVSRAEYAEQLSQALPFLLAGLTHAEFRESLIGTLRTFFADPRSLTLAITPESPISGTDIVGIIRSAPATLPDRLKASVTANTPE